MQACFDVCRVIMGETAAPSDQAVRREERLRIELSREYFRTSRFSMYASLAHAALMVTVSYSHTPPPILSAFVALALFTFLARSVILWRHDRHPPADPELGAWTTLYAGTSAVSGIANGVAAFGFMNFSDPASTIFVGMAIGGIMIGAVPGSSAHRWSLAAFVVPTGIGFVAGMLSAGEPEFLGLAVIGVVFCALILAYGRAYHCSLRDNIRLRLEADEMAEDLRTARRQAETANRSKTEFLANMSHVLRTPLNAILGFSQLIRDEASGPVGTEAYKEFAGDIHSSGQQLLEIINDVLDAARIERGEFTLNDSWTALRPIVDSALRMVSERAERGRLEVLPPAVEGAELYADRRVLLQMLIHLLTNACKYTPEGGTISVGFAQTDQGDWAVNVTDSGVGIAADDIPRILQPFAQVQSANDPTRLGSGLGLPLVKNWITMHDGRLEIDSSPGEGTTVTLIFPNERGRVRNTQPTSSTASLTIARSKAMS